MSKELERDLGLYAVVTISIGAMVGSGIFVLPGLASVIAGPSVVLAYFLAGLLVLPAALSKAEMASAMPEAGGTYLYIDRAMGPLLGTIAGLGTWFSLILKSAFALVGLGAYLVLFVDAPTKPVALGLATFLVVVNIFGVKQTGRLQAVIVSAVLAVLAFFIGDGLTHVEASNLNPFFRGGLKGLLEATGFVFVSYAGVTKIASVAEEVERPGRNIPLGILSSIALMILVYSFVVLVVVGVTTREQLGSTLTPMSDAAGQFLGAPGEVLIAVTAVLALTSMANAGILSSSRYPFAMGRYDLLPAVLSRTSARFRTPVAAILLTGGLLVVLIATVPVVELAKLASAFQILVFALVNLAVIFLRESELAWYEPEFRSPLYPWVQLFGIFGGLSLIFLMGWLPLVGAVGIVVVGYLWFRFYARGRIVREGAAPDKLRRTAKAYGLEQTRQELARPAGWRVLLAAQEEAHHADETLEAMVRLSAALTADDPDGSDLNVVLFEEVPDQLELGAAATELTAADREFEARMVALVENLGLRPEWSEIVTHDLRRAVVNQAERLGADVIVGHWGGRSRRWIMRNAPCHVVFVEARDESPPERIAVIADRGPHDPLEVAVADRIARTTGAEVTFIYPLPEELPEAQIVGAEGYHESLAAICSVPVRSEILRTDDRKAALLEKSRDYDLIIMGESGHRLVYDVIFGDVADEVADNAACNVMLVNSKKPWRHTFLRWVVEQVSY